MKEREGNGKLVIIVKDSKGTGVPIFNVPLSIYYKSIPTTRKAKEGKLEDTERCFEGTPDTSGYEGLEGEYETERNGQYNFEGTTGLYTVVADVHGYIVWGRSEIREGCVNELTLLVPIDLKVESRRIRDCESKPCDKFVPGETAEFYATHADFYKPENYDWNINGATIISVLENGRRVLARLNKIGAFRFKVTTSGSPGAGVEGEGEVVPEPPQVISGDLGMTLKRTATEPTPDLPLWVVIRNSTQAMSFNNYQKFIDFVLCQKPLSDEFIDTYEGKRFQPKKDRFADLEKRRYLPFTDTDAYRLLKVATEAFVIVNCGVALKDFQPTPKDHDFLVNRVNPLSPVDLKLLWVDYLEFVNGTSSQTLPYLALIRNKLPEIALKNSIFADADLPQDCFGILRNKLTEPCLIELIWSYWHEEGMLVQTMNAIGTRFQNRRRAGNNDPLANLEIDPLRPLNNLLWGHIQDEQHRLSVVRRTYEYDHHYGLRLEGKALPQFRPADSRSKFLEAFHNLLYICSGFFQQDDDTTVVSDGFPVLNALKEVHLVLSQGAHNQFGDLPSTARIEMLMEQWLLARPEFREFLPTRIMVAYPEPWMDRVDAMKKLQGWSDTSVLHFRDLGIFGEQILLSIRYGAWSDTNDPAQAKNWVRYWRPEIQGYIHAYRAVTGIDLTLEPVNFTLPSSLLRERLTKQIQKR
jgi:hypothetical protein